MTAENFQETLDVLMSRQPFKPFTVELHGGQRFEIDYHLAVSARAGYAIFTSPGGVPIFFDHDSVNQIIYSPAHAAPGKEESSNG